jgi:hypothetical protein
VSDFIKKFQEEAMTRRQELAPAVDEYERLMEIMEIIEFAIQQRDELLAKLNTKAGSKRNVDLWATTLDFDEIVKAGDLADEFNKSPSWARNHLIRLTDDGVLEKWGKGQWRRKPDRSGEAKLRVVTAG